SSGCSSGHGPTQWSGKLVSIYESDALDQIPEREMWDLVIANPPHFKDQHHGSIRHYDPDWIIHQKFYGAIKGHLNSEGVVLIQENFEGSDPMDFTGMIESGGLVYEGAFMWVDRGRRHYFDTYYFVLSRRDGRPGTNLSSLIDCSVPAV